VSWLDGFARHHDHRLVQRAPAAARVHRAVAEQIEHADYLHPPIPKSLILAAQATP
jgi:hypothetical protein